METTTTTRARAMGGACEREREQTCSRAVLIG